MTGRLRQLYFDLLHARSADPWEVESSPYERAKYERTIAALDDQRFERALEVGCSIGALSELLAPRCRRLVAIDGSRIAVRRARRRLAGAAAGVEVRRGRVPGGAPPGPFDLIVCSEVLYYLTRGQAERAIDELGAALAPGGSLLAVHKRERGRSTPLSGDEVHALLAARLPCERALEDSTPLYRLERFDAPAP